jgi:N-acyl-D-aspartate/D-glutamate deacylase
LSLEYIVKKQTHDTARLYGMTDRGTVEPGALGDLNLIDYDALALGGPYVKADLPAGGRRLLQAARGYIATIKKGTVTFDRGEATGELPGRLVRGSR